MVPERGDKGSKSTPKHTLLQSNLKPLSDNLQGLTQKFSGLEAAQNDLQAQFLAQRQQTSPVKSSVPTPLSCISVSNEVGSDNDSEFVEQDDEDEKIEDINQYQDNSPLDQIFESNSRQFWVPEQKHIDLWNSARNMDPTNNHKEDWSKPIAVKVRKFLTSHPSAKPFLGPSPDDDVPDLRYNNKKLLEKQLSTLHSSIGAGAAALTDLLSSTELVIENLQKTAADYSNPEVQVADPREEAAEIFSTLAAEFKDTYVKKAINALRLLADGHNKVTSLRRSQYVDNVTSGSEARNMVRRLQPSKQFLFGGDIQKVCKSLKDGNQLSTVLQRKPSFGFKGPKKDFKGTKGGRVDRFRSKNPNSKFQRNFLSKN